MRSITAVGGVRGVDVAVELVTVVVIANEGEDGRTVGDGVGVVV